MCVRFAGLSPSLFNNPTILVCPDQLGSFFPNLPEYINLHFFYCNAADQKGILIPLCSFLGIKKIKS